MKILLYKKSDLGENANNLTVVAGLCEVPRKI